MASVPQREGRTAPTEASDSNRAKTRGVSLHRTVLQPVHRSQTATNLTVNSLNTLRQSSGNAEIDAVFDRVMNRPLTELQIPPQNKSTETTGKSFPPQSDTITAKNPKIEPLPKNTHPTGNASQVPTSSDNILNQPIAFMRLLTTITRLEADGSNYTAWLLMLNQCLEFVTKKRGILYDRNIKITVDEDIAIKQALMFTVDNKLKLGVAEIESGVEAFGWLSDAFTVRSRTTHVELVRKALNTKFNANDPKADVEVHF